MSSDFARSRVLIPSTVFLTVGGLFAALWGVVHDRTQSEIRLRASLTAEQVADHIEDKMDVCFRLMRGLQEEWESGQIPSQTVFEQRAGSVIRYFPSISAIQTLDESDNILWSVPDKGHMAGLTPTMGRDARLDLRTGKIAADDSIRVTQAIHFADDSVRLLAFLPLRSGGANALRVSLAVSTLIEDALREDHSSIFAYIIRDEGDPIYRSVPAEDLPNAAYSPLQPFDVADRKWTAGAAPRPSATEMMLGLGTDLVLVCGFLVAGSMAFVSARLLSSQQRLRENEERLRTIAENIPSVVSSYETAPGKPRTLIYLGPGIEAFVGPREATEVRVHFDRLFELIHPDDRRRMDESAARGSARGQPVDCEARLMKDDGAYRWVHLLSRPMPPDHDRTRWDMVIIDITEHRRTIEALHESRERYRALVESSPVGVMIDRDGVFQFVNPAAVKLLGYERAEELIGKEIFTVVPPRFHDMVRQRVAQTSLEHEPVRFNDERLVRRDGSEVDVEIIASNIRFEGRSVRQTLVLDTTEQRQAEQRQRLLMQELDHRVKNNLASVLALLDQTAASTSDFGVFRVKFSNRIKAMARTHEILSRNKWSPTTLNDIMRLSASAHVVDNPDRVCIEDSSLVVSPRAALPIGLALHELATNALKYGSLSVPNGRVELRSTVEDQCVVLRWSESGGPPATEPAALGTGLQLVRGLVEFELGGAAVFDFRPQGLVCTLRIDASMLNPARLSIPLASLPDTTRTQSH